MTEEKNIPERDKPFVLALISSGITISCLAIAFFGAYTNNDNLKDLGLEALKFTFSLTTMAWAFYFKRK